MLHSFLFCCVVFIWLPFVFTVYVFQWNYSSKSPHSSGMSPFLDIIHLFIELIGFFFFWYSVRNFLFVLVANEGWNPATLFLKHSLRPHPILFPHRGCEQCSLGILSTQTLATQFLGEILVVGEGQKSDPNSLAKQRWGRWGRSELLNSTFWVLPMDEAPAWVLNLLFKFTETLQGSYKIWPLG